MEKMHLIPEKQFVASIQFVRINNRRAKIILHVEDGEERQHGISKKTHLHAKIEISILSEMQPVELKRELDQHYEIRTKKRIFFKMVVVTNIDNAMPILMGKPKSCVHKFQSQIETA